MIAWANLWKWVCFRPGTMWKRIALCGWQCWLMAAPTVGGMLAGWRGALGGAVAAFWSHELCFGWYAETVARTPLMDDGDVVGVAHRADYTFERWIGPVC